MVVIEKKDAIKTKREELKKLAEEYGIQGRLVRLLTPEDYYDGVMPHIVKRVVSTIPDEEDKKALKLYLSAVFRAYKRVSEELSSSLKEEPDINEIIRQLKEDANYYINDELRKLVLRGKIRGTDIERAMQIISWTTIDGIPLGRLFWPPAKISINLSTKKVGVYPIIHPRIEHLVDKELVSKAYAEYFGLPHLVHFDPEEIEQVIEDDQLLNLLLHPAAEDFVRKVASRYRAFDVIKALSSLRDPHYLLSRHEDLPLNVFHPDVLQELADLDKQRLIDIVERLAQKKEHVERASPEGTKKLVALAKEKPHLIDEINHWLLVENADLLPLIRKNPALAYALKEAQEKLHQHDKASLRKLLLLAIGTGNVDRFKKLIEHPDLHPHYDHLMDPRVRTETVELLLENKEKWKDLHPDLVKEAVRDPNKLRVLLSDLPSKEKEKLLRSGEIPDEEELRVLELVHKFGVPREHAVIALKQLGPRAGEFLASHGKNVSDPRLLEALAIYYKHRGKVSDHARKLIDQLLSTVEGAEPGEVAKAVLNLEEEGLLPYAAQIPEKALSTFSSYSLSSPSNLSKELVSFVRNRYETSRRIPGRDPEGEMRAMLEEGVTVTPSGEVKVSKRLKKKLGVSRFPGVKEFRRALLDFMVKEYGLNRTEARQLLERLGIKDIAGSRKRKRK